MISKVSIFKISNICAVVGAIALLAMASPAKAQSPVGVAAVVNDDPISIIDLVERIKLVAVSSNIRMTPEKATRSRRKFCSN